MELKFSKIVDRELKKTEMHLYGTLGSAQGEINGHRFAEELSWLGRNYDEITIRVNCDGGEVLHGLSIVSEMMASKAYIIVSVDGIAASMGAVLLAAADKVVMNDYAKVMIHSPYYVDENGDVVKNLSEKAKKGLNSLKEILSKLLQKRGITEDRVNELMKTDSWFGADEALTEKLVDEVVATGRKTELAALEPMKLVAQIKSEFIVEPNKEKSMKKIAAKFGLPEDATEDQIIAKMVEQNSAGSTKMVDQLVTLGRALGTVTDDNVEKVKRVANADFELASEMYLTVAKAEEEDDDADDAPGKKETLLKDLVNKGKTPAKTEKKWAELSEQEIETLRAKDQAGYKSLFKAHYGFEPTIE